MLLTEACDKPCVIWCLGTSSASSPCPSCSVRTGPAAGLFLPQELCTFCSSFLGCSSFCVYPRCRLSSGVSAEVPPSPRGLTCRSGHSDSRPVIACPSHCFAPSLYFGDLMLPPSCYRVTARVPGSYRAVPSAPQGLWGRRGWGTGLQEHCRRHVRKGGALRRSCTALLNCQGVH